jgi:hypothetical protein
MSPLIPCILSNVETQLAMIKENGLILNLNKAIKTEIEDVRENKRGRRITLEDLLSDNPNLAINKGRIISTIRHSECGLSIMFNWLAKIDTSISDSILIVGTLVECNTKKIIEITTEMYFSCSPFQSNSRVIDSVPTSKFRYQIYLTNRSS